MFFFFVLSTFLPTLTFKATRYLPPNTPQVGPLDPVTFKEAALFTCMYGSIRPTSGVTPVFLPFYVTCGSFGTGNMQRSRASLLGIRVH